MPQVCLVPQVYLAPQVCLTLSPIEQLRLLLFVEQLMTVMLPKIAGGRFLLGREM